ncbi:MAG: hypothetical protein QOI41_2080 [Myxococcales bacterium]|nr:hypothetical protein [Myxococcales bacterium]
MQAPRAYSLAFVAVVTGLAGLGTGCHVEANVKASTSDDARSDFSEPATVTPAAAQTTTAAAAPAVSTPSAPPTDACPLHCYEARGSEAVPLTNEEVAQLRSALEPVIGRMRQCVAPEEWRRHGSATVNLRIAPDGTLAELGVDPGHGGSNSCFDDVGRGASASVTLPGHKVVRCAERCVSETPRRGRRAR